MSEQEKRCDICFGPGPLVNGVCAAHPQPEQPATQNWKMEQNKVYQSIGPDGTEIAVMSWDTWINMNTGIESLRQALGNQSKLAAERGVEYEAALRRLADVTTRLENLRAVRREELRKDIEGQLNIPSQG